MTDDWVGKYFKRSEFQCSRVERPCTCGLANIHPSVPLLFDEVRKHLGVPLEILSGVRCVVGGGNKKAGGRPKSFHIPRNTNTGEIDDVDGLCLAADITFANHRLRNPINICRLYMLLESFGIRSYSPCIGLGLYDWGVHCDLRGLVHRPSARWESFKWNELK